MTSEGTKRKKKGKYFSVKTSKTTEADSALKILNKQLEDFDISTADKFEQYPLSAETKQGLKFASFEKPTPIQTLAIHRALHGSDILGAAKTGSGKTLAFLVPVLEKLYKLKWSSVDGVGAVIISPTRELATQIFDVLRKIGKFHKFIPGLIIGGTNAKFVQKEQEFIKRSNIIVCTPGRLLDHIEHAPNFALDDLKVLVLDEADRLLDSGFKETINAIIESLPVERQTLLFSATQTRSVKDLARLSLKNPVYVSPDGLDEKLTPGTLTERYIVCDLAKKLDFLWSFLKTHLKKKVLVFFSTCKQVRFVYEIFCKMRPGIPLLRLHRALKQHQRLATYESFSRKQFAALFATNVAARGLDFSSVHWVIQMDCPCDAVTYVHRVGRTARNEKTGNSLLVLTPTEEEGMVEELEKKKVTLERIRVNPKELKSIKSKIQALCIQQTELADFAKVAFVSYMKDVFKMSNKKIFDIKKLPLQEFAESLGLYTVPKMRFITRAEKLRKNNEDIDDGDDSGSESDEELLNETKTSASGKSLIDVDASDESDGSDEFLSVKKVLPAIPDDGENRIEVISRRKKKPLTKIGEKKMLLKSAKPVRYEFDEQGEIIRSNPAHDPVDDVLDHVKDRKLHKERLAKERQLKKQKLKERKKARKENQDHVSKATGVRLKTQDESDGEEDDDNDDDEIQHHKEKENVKKQSMMKNKRKRPQDDERQRRKDPTAATSDVKKMKLDDNSGTNEGSLSWLI